MACEIVTLQGINILKHNNERKHPSDLLYGIRMADMVCFGQELITR